MEPLDRYPVRAAEALRLNLHRYNDQNETPRKQEMAERESTEGSARAYTSSEKAEKKHDRARGEHERTDERSKATKPDSADDHEATLVR